ncbi:MAG: hypothetical protein ABSB88_23995 [Bryobacteraceae bacterium]|jgi:uncharacterized protein (TIGR03437 family)
MDAAYNSLKKTVFFVVATALLLAAPICANAQPTIVLNPTLGAGGTIQLGNITGCNDSQILTLTSTGSAIGIQVSVTYVNNQVLDPVNGNWLYARVSNAALNANNGTTAPVLGGSTNQTFNTLVPISTSATGINLVIGLNRTVTGTTEQATVLLHVTDSSGASDVSITVNYSKSLSCGVNTGSLTNGYITITPASLTMTAAQGGSQTLGLTIQNNTGSTIYFSAATPPGDTWLSTNSTLSTPVAGNSSATVNVTANATGLNVTTYSSQGVTITSSGQGAVLIVPVTFAVTTGSGASGTLTLDGGTVATRSFQYIAAGSSATGIPTASCINIVDSNTSITSYNDSFTTNSGGNWLTVNNSPYSPQYNQSFSGGPPPCLQVQANSTVASLASGLYTATVTVTDATGSTATANITLYVSSGSASGVTVSPGVIFNFPGVVTGATATESQQFTVSATSPTTLGTATVQSSAPWLAMTSPTGVGTGTEQFTLTAYPSGLAAGIYSTTIVVLSSNPTGATTILVSLAVGQSSGCGGCGSVTSAVVPTSLSFAQEHGSGAWSGGSEAQTITITGASGTSWSSSVAYAGSVSPWLRFGGPSGATGGTFGSGPAALTVDIQPSNLAASTTPYTATITVTTPSGNTQVLVSLLVTQAGTHVLLASPATALFTYNGGATPASQNVVFSDSNGAFPGTSGSFPSIAVTASTTWLVATSVGNTMTLTANPTGLATGVYSGSATVTSSTYPNSPLTYPAVLVVNGGASTGPLTLSTSGLTFNATAGGSAPTPQNLTVTAQSQTNVSVSVSEQNCSNTTWLFISPSGSVTTGTSGSTFSVSVFQSGIQAGSNCSGTIIFTTGSVTQTVSVSMVVAASSTGGNVTVTPSTPLSFSYTTGGSNPATQTLAIASASGSSGVSFTVTSSASWLTTNVNSASTPYTLTVTANPSGLAASSTPYAATLTIAPNGGTAVVVNVTFAIAGLPVVSATPTTLSFTYSVGGSNPPTQAVHVSGGGAAATFSATPASSGWLQLSATSGTTPNTGTFDITVTANPLNLNAGQTYNGSITIAGTGQATGSTIVNVTFAVSAPIPTISKVTNAASYATGAVSPGEVISIFANTSNPIGPTPAVQLSSANCPSPCTSVPTTMGGVQVVFLPQGIAAPLIYVSATQINAVVPYEVQTAGSNLSVEVKYLGQASNAFVLQTAATAPGIISLNGSGTGTAAMNQYDASGNYQGINSGSNPASPGWILVLYVTGEGSIPSAVTGAVTGSNPAKPLVGPPSVLVDNLPATVQYYGEASGIVSGVMQINVLIPTGIRTSQADGISFTIGGNTSQSGVTVQIK